MSYYNQRGYSFDEDDVEFYPPSNPSPPFSARLGGYHVSSVSSLLPSTSSIPTPIQNSSTSYAHPGLPSLNSYHQFQAQRQQDLHAQEASYGRSVTPEQGQRRMSAYRQQRQAEMAQARSPSPRRKLLPVIPLQPQAYDIPAPPPFTRFDSGPTTNQRRNIEEQAATGMGSRIPGGVMTGLGDGAISAFARGNHMPLLPASSKPTYVQASSKHPRNNLGNRSLSPETRRPLPHQFSSSSRTGLDANAAVPGLVAPNYRTTSLSPNRVPSPIRSDYSFRDDGHSMYAPSLATPNRAVLGTINPMEIADDDEDPFSSIQAPGKRGLSAGAGGTNGGFFKGLGGRDTSGSYGQVPGGGGGNGVEKSDWLSRQTSGRKRLKWILAGSLALIIVLAVAGGVIGALFRRRSSTSSSDDGDNGTTLTKSSPEITALLNNPNLHKVFPAIDYTPANTQYPACLTDPATQNSITKDVAVLSQLTPQIRLYGTDCNQTDLVLRAIDLLDLQSSLKVWMGVWLENNATTNTRQLAQMYNVLSTHGTNQLAGVIVGNEVLFRGDMTQADLVDMLQTVKSNLTTAGYALKVGTADLGSEWSATLAEAVDVVGANVHPFFGGVLAADAAAWTWQYWQRNDVSTTDGLSGKTNVVAETGWPTDGGYNSGSVAGVDGLNAFLEDWVCDALTNGTEYFWFEAFDEPWKASFDDTTETDGAVETHWGLMDSDRNLKSGVKIPDCGGQTAG